MPFLALLKSPLLLKALGVAAVLAVMVGAWEMTPVVGPQARIERVKESRDGWKAKALEVSVLAKGWERSFRQAERLRVAEHASALEALNETQAACTARVAEARSSAKVIERIVNAPPKSDANGCPVRVLVDPGELRDAIGAPTR